MLSGRPDLSRIGFGVGWVGWKNLLLVEQLLLLVVEQFLVLVVEQLSEPNSLLHSCFKEIFGGGRGDMKTFSYNTSPVFQS